MPEYDLAQRLAIREVIENWVLWRDAGDWDRFRTVWAPDGRMMATWFQGRAEDFIAVSRAGFARGVRILHFLGGSSVDVSGGRAVAQTKMTITQRARVDGTLCDVVCTGRFYDFFRRAGLVGSPPPRSSLARTSATGGGWQIVLRQPIYESDRLDPVDPGASVSLDPGLLQRFPVGYRHLAYLQTRLGFAVKPDLPGLVGPAVEELYRRGADWLSGAPVAAILAPLDGGGHA
jgi:hypothetical protein